MGLHTHGQQIMKVGKMMKIIFSRKGFDSSSGGCPSPILPDGRMLSLPIPDKQSPIKYQDIRWHEYNLGEIVASLTKNKTKADHYAHLDPDLNIHSLLRNPEWIPLLGQSGSAQGHLRNNDVTAGDVFLFFGLFKEVTLDNGSFIWKNDALCKHVIWGWLQVGQIIPVEADLSKLPSWVSYHPHLHGERGNNNTLYLAKAAGVFSHYSEQLQLTAPNSPTPGTWLLPGWVFPEQGKTPLSYHSNLQRWGKKGRTAELKAVSRGQEFVLDSSEYPESYNWLQELLNSIPT